jgi:hypothetical protein
MKTRLFSVSLALIFCCSSLISAQEYAFKVLVNKGKNEVKSGANWEPVKVGASLKSPDELKVTENAYVGLIHISGKPLELKNAGKYKVVDLSAKVGSGSSVLNKYTDFILSANTQKKNNLAATGAVHRGPLGKIAVYLPPTSSYVYGDTITIEWEKDKAMGPPYEVIFTSLFGDELHKIETSENSISVNLRDAKFSSENDITVQVFSKKDKKESDPFTLRKFSKADKDRMNAAFKEVGGQTSAKTALNSLVQAAFFEQNKLLADAVTAYKKAIKLEPDVPSYQEAYDSFLLRNNLKILPKK